MAAFTMRMRPSSQGPPPNPPTTGIDTASATAAPTTGPELVKLSRAAPASSSRFASATRSSFNSTGTASAAEGMDLYSTP